MTSDTPYIRNTLTATHQGIPDPSSLVDLWLDQFLEAVAADLLGEPYDCLALFGRLQRCRPDLIAATGRQQTWQTACEQVRTNLADLAERAASVPDPNGWLREASSLADACDEGVGDAELTDWAAELLADLDDADLIAWALGPGSNDALEEGLGRCHAWLADNPDRFFPAGVLVQGIGHALRPDLPAVDADLTATADKYVLILDALEEAEAALRPRALRRSFTPGSPKAGWAWLPTPLAMAAQGATAGGLVRLRWRSPGGEFRAVLVADPADLSARTVRVNFLAGSSPAVALVGWPARLAGCVAILDAEANADFDLAVVAAARQAGRQCDLAVGEEQQVWLLETGS